MFDVVGLGQHEPADQVVQGQQRQHDPAKGEDQRRGEQGAQPPDLQQLVGVVPEPALLGLEAAGLDLHCPDDGPGDFAQGEGVEALAEAGAGAVLGRGDAAVMAGVVLEGEVAVTDQRVGDLGRAPVELLARMAQFVADVYQRAVEQCRARHQHERCQRSAIARRRRLAGPGVDPKPGRDQHGVDARRVDRNGQVQQRLEKRVTPGALLLLGAEVEPVTPAGEVQQRDQAVEDHRQAQRQPGLVPDPDQRQHPRRDQRGDKADQPADPEGAGQADLRRGLGRRARRWVGRGLGHSLTVRNQPAGVKRRAAGATMRKGCARRAVHRGGAGEQHRRRGHHAARRQRQ